MSPVSKIANDRGGKDADLRAGDDDTRPRETDMRPTRPELLSGFFLTLVLFLGVIVSGLFLLWTLHRRAMQAEIHHSRPTRTEFVDELGGPLEGEFAIPSPGEYRALQEPSLNTTLDAVSAAVNETAASLDRIPNSTSRPGSTIHDFHPRDEGSVDIIPRFHRWQLNFSAKNVDQYAAQLDHFGIELGVVGGGIQGVDILSNLSSDLQTRRIVDTNGERRLYFRWMGDSPLKTYEETLIKKSGVEPAGRHLLRFLPTELENELARIELEFAEIAGHDCVSEIARSVFESIPSENGYEFRIVEQRYRAKD